MVHLKMGNYNFILNLSNKLINEHRLSLFIAPNHL
jgi:hypothetical protein